MDPMNDSILQKSCAPERNRRAWGTFSIVVAGIAGFTAFLNGSFLSPAHSAVTDAAQDAWTLSLAAGVREAVSVPGDFATIQAAIDGSADGATILIAPGTYRERIELRGRSLHLWGVGGAVMTTLSGNGADGPVACVRGGSVQFDGISFEGGRGESGRGASVQDGAARFTACRFVGNAGGASASDARVRFEGCEFAGNRAGLEGGALQSERSEVRLEACTIRDNAAGTFGGGVSAHHGVVEFVDTRLRANRVVSGAWGGGVYAEGTEVRMQGGCVEANASAASGAGIYLLGGEGHLRGVRFADNLSPEARSVHGEQATVRIEGGSVVGHVAGNFTSEVRVEGSEIIGADEDRDGDGVPDRFAIERGWVKDCDANGVPDTVDTDCNANGIVDACEIRRGLAKDDDGDGLIDSCAAREREALAMAEPAAEEPLAP